jgi:hypothetical protein
MFIFVFLIVLKKSKMKILKTILVAAVCLTRTKVKSLPICCQYVSGNYQPKTFVLMLVNAGN